MPFKEYLLYSPHAKVCDIRALSYDGEGRPYRMLFNARENLSHVCSAHMGKVCTFLGLVWLAGVSKYFEVSVCSPTSDRQVP